MESTRMASNYRIVTHEEVEQRRAARRGAMPRVCIEIDGRVIARHPTPAELAEAQGIAGGDGDDMVQVPRDMLEELIAEAQDFARRLGDVYRADAANVAEGWLRGDLPMFVELSDGAEVLFANATTATH